MGQDSWDCCSVPILPFFLLTMVWVCGGFPLGMNLAEKVNKELSFKEEVEGHRRTDRHSISLHREAMVTGFLAEVQQALSPKHRHAKLVSCAFDTARTRISGSNEKSKEDIKVTRKILNQPTRLLSMWQLFIQLYFRLTTTPPLLNVHLCSPCHNVIHAWKTQWMPWQKFCSTFFSLETNELLVSFNGLESNKSDRYIKELLIAWWLIHRPI